MKKLLTLLLALCMVVSLAPMAFAAGDPAPYISVLQARAAEHPDANFGEAMLCDLNGDDSDELVLFYLNDGINATVEVFTTANGRAVQAMAPKTVYAQAGGNTGYVGQATRDGKTYLLTFSAAPEIFDETIVTTGEATLYSLRGGRLVADTQMSYTETIYIGPEGSNIEPYLLEDQSFSVINGDKRSYSAMESVIDALQLPMWNLGFTSTEYDDDAEPIKSFLNGISTGFDDVSAGAYYAQSVMWAAENGVTTGTSATKFSPEASCTRAQFVTFLWRAMGSPAPKSEKNPFSDVKSGAYYYDAVLWAVEKGITTGTSATKFSPNATLTRAQTVTFLWRLEGEPGGQAHFYDVPAGAYYADAVAWAAQKGITTGTSADRFSPNQTCTRAQTVTFLYRDLVG